MRSQVSQRESAGGVEMSELQLQWWDGFWTQTIAQIPIKTWFNYYSLAYLQYIVFLNLYADLFRGICTKSTN